MGRGEVKDMSLFSRNYVKMFIPEILRKAVRPAFMNFPRFSEKLNISQILNIQNQILKKEFTKENLFCGKTKKDSLLHMTNILFRK